MFIGAIIIAGNGTRTDINPLTDAAVTQVAQMAGLAVLAKGRILELDKITHLAAGIQHCAGTHTCERSDITSPQAAHSFQHAVGVDPGSRRQLAIFQHTAGTDLNAITKTDIAFKYHVDINVYVTTRLYLATHHGLYVVAPDGKAVRVSDTGDDFMGFTPHPTDPETLYASGHPAKGGNLGFIVSSDGGKSWKKLADGVGGPVDFHQMDVSKADPNIVCGISGSLQVSKDAGRSWKMVGPAPKGTIDLAASARDADTLYAATRRGIVKSTDGGRSWEAAFLILRSTTMIEAAADGTLYAFQIGTGLIRTSEPSWNWQLVSNDFGDAYILHLAIDPSDGQKLYAVTFDTKTRAQAILASRDGGATWTKLGSE